MKLKYSIRKLSELAGVSARTLRYYDEIGLAETVRNQVKRDIAIMESVSWRSCSRFCFTRERGLELKADPEDPVSG